MKDLDLKKRIDQLKTPGHVETFTPDEAEKAGAFEEDALTLDEAEDSVMDLYEDTRSI